MFSPLLKVGASAFDFHLLDQSSHTVHLEACLTSQGLLLFFFSSNWLAKDIKLLKEFAEAYPRFQQAGIEVLGISSTNWESLHHLAQQMHLPYRVLFDPCAKISKHYKTLWIPKFITGRAIYKINAQGNIETATKKISPQQFL